MGKGAPPAATGAMQDNGSNRRTRSHFEACEEEMSKSGAWALDMQIAELEAQFDDQIKRKLPSKENENNQHTEFTHESGEVHDLWTVGDWKNFFARDVTSR